MRVGTSGRAISFGPISAGVTGIQKLIATSQAAISNNSFMMFIESASVTSGKVNFKDIRLFELPHRFTNRIRFHKPYRRPTQHTLPNVRRL